MHRISTVLVLLVLGGCAASAPGGGKGRAGSGAPGLQAFFDSREAAVRLTWGRALGPGFAGYEIQRSTGEAWTVVDTVPAVEDTTYVHYGIEAGASYRYRIAACFGSPGSEQALYSAVAVGGIHQCAGVWDIDTEPSFVPTRLAVDRTGIVAAAGVGGPRVIRFAADGTRLRDLVYADGALACLAAAALDGPSLAYDSRSNLYVIYNLQRPDARPQALWTKFDAGGQSLWTHELDGLFARHIVIDEEDRIYIESITQIQTFDPDGAHQQAQHVPAVLVSSLRVWSGRFAALVEPLSLLEGDWQAPRLVVYEGAGRSSAERVIGRDPVSERDSGDGLLQRPTDFAVDRAGGRAFIVNAGLSRIEVFRDQTFLTRWGSEGEQAGQFRFQGIARVVDDLERGTLVERPVVAGGIARDASGFIYVADAFNHRIQRFRP